MSCRLKAIVVMPNIVGSLIGFPNEGKEVFGGAVVAPTIDAETGGTQFLGSPVRIDAPDTSGRRDPLSSQTWSGQRDQEWFRLRALSLHRDQSSQTKNGPPNSAVATPTGISTGASTLRETVSQMTRKAPPPKIQAGKRTRWSGPTMR